MHLIPENRNIIYNSCSKQCCGSGSPWIRIDLVRCVPDPGGKKGRPLWRPRIGRNIFQVLINKAVNIVLLPIRIRILMMVPMDPDWHQNYVDPIPSFTHMMENPISLLSVIAFQLDNVLTFSSESKKS